MEDSKNIATTSSALLHFEDNNDDNNTVTYNDLSNEQLAEKLQMFHKMYLEKKINGSNAFDIDIIGYLSAWLKKKKESDININLFNEIIDYLDTAGGIYNCRIKYIIQITKQLNEQLKALVVLDDKNKNEEMETSQENNTNE